MGSEQCGETADCDGGGEGQGRGGRRLKIPRACECTPLPSSRSSSLPSPFSLFTPTRVDSSLWSSYNVLWSIPVLVNKNG